MREKTLFRLTWKTESDARAQSDHDTEDDARLEIVKVRERGYTPVRLERLDPSPHHSNYDVTTLPIDLGAHDEADVGPPELEQAMREIASAPPVGEGADYLPLAKALAKLPRNEGEPEG